MCGAKGVGRICSTDRQGIKGSRLLEGRRVCVRMCVCACISGETNCVCVCVCVCVPKKRLRQKHGVHISF